MQRMMLGALVLCTVALTGPRAFADDAANKQIKALNELTGVDPAEGMLRDLMAHPDQAKLLIETALPLAAQDEKLSYNAALVLGLAAADLKDLAASDTFFHLCARMAAKAQSTRKLAQAYGTLIELYFDAKKYGQCARTCQEVLDLKTDDGTQRIVYRMYADDRGNVDTFEDAKFDSAKALRPMVANYLVKALAKQGKHPEALKLAKKLVKNATDWRGERLQAWVLRESGALADAAKLYEHVIKAADRDPDLDVDDRATIGEALQAELSNLYVELHQIDKAAALLEALLKKRPDEPGYYNDLGYILADYDVRLDEAETLIRKALALDKQKRAKSETFDAKTDRDNGAYLDSLGWVLFKKKQYAEARKYLEQAVEDKAAKHIEIYDHLGDVCEMLGDRAAAVRAWEEGLRHVTDTRRDQERRSAVERKLERAKSKSASK